MEERFKENVQVFGGENGSFDPSLGVISTPDYGRVFISVSNTQGTNLSLEEKNSLIHTRTVVTKEQFEWRISTFVEHFYRLLEIDTFLVENAFFLLF